MSGCISDCPTPAPCNCAKDERCATQIQTCTTCSYNFCEKIPTVSSGSTNLGATIGGAIGGIGGLFLVLGLLYFCWWKPKGLAASQKRYSTHISKSRMSKQSSEKKGPLSPGPRSTIRSSVSSNPFDDRRTSVGTSDFSFRSSRSTNIIPIAYIPPHATSISIDDSTRGGFGELPDAPISMDRDGRRSLAPSVDQSDTMSIHPLPAAAIGPVRPPRTPGLDLHLKSTTPQSPTSPRKSEVSFLSVDPMDYRSSGSSSSRATQRAQNHLSTMSTMSTATSRSNVSTMSYILDPPQIITPGDSSLGPRRVELLGRGQAGLVRLPSSAKETIHDPFADDVMLESEDAQSRLSYASTSRTVSIGSMFDGIPFVSPLVLDSNSNKFPLPPPRSPTSAASDTTFREKQDEYNPNGF